MEKPRFSPSSAAVVIVNYQTMELTQAAVSSTLSEPEVVDVVVVDNASDDGSAEALRQAFTDTRVRVVDSGWNRGFGPAVNFAAAMCDAPLLLILNSDAAIGPGSLGLMAAALLTDEGIGLIAPSVYHSDGHSLQGGTYGRLPTRRDMLVSNGWVRTGSAGDRSSGAAPGWVSGVAMLLRRVDFLGVGGFDEAFTMYLEDVDLCRRLAAAGKAVRREPLAVVIHHGGKSWRSRRDQTRRFHESKLRYFEKLGASRIELWGIRLVGRIRLALTRP